MLSLNDKVKISEYYLSIYPNWAPQIKDKIATIISLEKKKVLFSNLDTDSKFLYRNVFGNKTEYDYYHLVIEFEDKAKYIVSNFGVQKI